MIRFLLLTMLLLAAGGYTADAGSIRMSQMYSDGMVLQRDVPLVIKGQAAPGEAVSVKLEGPFKTMKKSAKASSDGLWEVAFSPLKAGTGLTLTIEGRNERIVYEDVAAGDVWVCSGQSNMFFRVFEGLEIGETPADSGLRLYNMRPRYYVNDERWSDEAIANTQNMDFYHPTSWVVCDGENMRDFSAVGYHFGAMLRESLDVPIGLVCNAIGGAPAEAWIPESALKSEYTEVLAPWFDNKILNGWCIDMGKKNLGYPETGATKHPYAPCYLFDAAIAPMEQFPVKGVVWYQGESNDYDIAQHEKLFPILVESWREYWSNPEMPFHFVQLSSLNRHHWPAFRDSQRKLAEQIPHCEMAVSSDLGDSLDIHPRYKRPVGERLARQALHHDYGMSDVTPCGPVLKEAMWKGEQIELVFDYADGLKTSDGQALRCFEVAGYDEVFVAVEAVIKDGKVFLSAPMQSPMYVRYAWQAFTRANLVNGEGLPASTFKATIAR